MPDTIIPDFILHKKDYFGYHKIKVYKDDRMLKEILRRRIQEQEHNQDSIYLDTSSEGKGKSMLLLRAYEVYCELKGEVEDIKHIGRTVAEFEKIISELKRKHFVALDEGSELSGDRSSERKFKKFKEKMTVIRERAFIMFICFINPLKVATYFREDRIRGVFAIRKQGEVWYYANSEDNPHFQSILNIWDKVNKTRSMKDLFRFAPDFIMHFKEYKGAIREAYDKRKDTNIDSILKLEEDSEIPEGYISVEKASKLLHVGPKTIEEFATLGVIKFEYFGLKRMLHILELENIKIYYGIHLPGGKVQNDAKNTVSETTYSETSILKQQSNSETERNK